MELNNIGEVLLLTDSKVLIQGMQGVTKRTSLNWLCLGVFQQFLHGGGWLLDVNLPGPKLVSQGATQG